MTGVGGFTHEALFYAGTREFVDRTADFVREGVLNGEPVLVMVTGDKIDLLRSALGSTADLVAFEGMDEVGRNPGRIISAWSDFAKGHPESGRMRGLGEPIWAERSADELVECQQHESLLNLAFAEADGFRLQCPYDTEALPSDVIDEARHSHPLLVEGDVTRSSDEYRGTDTLAHPRGSLPVPRGPAEEMAFDRYRLDLVRRLVEEHAEAAALVGIRAEDLVVAVNEVASNSVKHGGGNGVVRIWCEPGTILCEVRDSGRVDEPLAGRRRPVAGAIGGHGLWIAHQLCDLVQVRSVRGGTVVRLHMLLPSG